MMHLVIKKTQALHIPHISYSDNAITYFDNSIMRRRNQFTKQRVHATTISPNNQFTRQKNHATMLSTTVISHHNQFRPQRFDHRVFSTAKKSLLCHFTSASFHVLII